MVYRVIALAIFLVFYAPTTLAKCKVKESGETQAIGKKYTVAATMTTGVRVQFLQDGDAIYVDAIFRTVLSGIDADIDGDTPLLLQFQDGDELALYPLIDLETKRSFLGFAVNRKVTGGLYVIPEESLEELLGHDILEIVLQYKTEGQADSRTWKTRKGDRKRFREGLACIVEHRASTQ